MWDDPEFNIQFVALVENLPCLYDINNDDYHRAYRQEQAWRKIAKHIGQGATVQDCKARWRNLRGRFTKHLKSYATSGTAMLARRPYYLAEHLNFLMPFMRSRTPKGQTASQKKEQSQDSVEDTSTQDLEDVDCPDIDINFENDSKDSIEEVEDMSREGDQNEHTSIIWLDEELANANDDESASTSLQGEDNREEKYTSRLISKKRTATVVSHSATIKKLRECCHDKSKNHDKSRRCITTIDEINTPLQIPQYVEINDSDAFFLMSMLPDLKRMSDFQKRKFKVETLILAGDILGDDAQESAASPTSTSSTSCVFRGIHVPGISGQH